MSTGETLLSPYNIVEPPNKGHFGANSFVPCREVIPISEGPSSEVPSHNFLKLSVSKFLYITVYGVVCITVNSGISGVGGSLSIL